MHHVIASVTFSKTVPQPKINGVKSGYAPLHKFLNLDYLVSGFHTYSDADVHYPGETVNARIVFPSWEFFGKDVKVGDRFEIVEMNRMIGCGIVQSIDGVDC